MLEYCIKQVQNEKWVRSLQPHNGICIDKVWTKGLPHSSSSCEMASLFMRVRWINAGWGFVSTVWEPWSSTADVWTQRLGKEEGKARSGKVLSRGLKNCLLIFPMEDFQMRVPGPRNRMYNSTAFRGTWILITTIAFRDGNALCIDFVSSLIWEETYSDVKPTRSVL